MSKNGPPRNKDTKMESSLASHVLFADSVISPCMGPCRRRDRLNPNRLTPVVLTKHNQTGVGHPSVPDSRHTDTSQTSSRRHFCRTNGDQRGGPSSGMPPNRVLLGFLLRPFSWSHVGSQKAPDHSKMPGLWGHLFSPSGPRTPPGRRERVAPKLMIEPTRVRPGVALLDHDRNCCGVAARKEGSLVVEVVVEVVVGGGGKVLSQGDP